jgi:hypothetical protein
LIFIFFLSAFNALSTDQVTAHLHRLTTPEAVASKGRLHVSRRETRSNERENTHPDDASKDVLLQHFLTLLRQMDAAKNSNVIDKLSMLERFRLANFLVVQRRCFAVHADFPL